MWKISLPPGLFLFSLCTLSALLCPDCPGFAFCPLLYNTHNTNYHAPGGIRTRDPSNRSAVEPRLRPVGCWDRRIQSLDHEASSHWLYHCAIPPDTYFPSRSVSATSHVHKTVTKRFTLLLTYHQVRATSSLHIFNIEIKKVRLITS